MKGKMSIYYDEKGDYLDIFIGAPKSNYGEEVSEGITIFKDETTDEVVGIGILNFKKRAENLREIRLNLPVDLGLFSE